MRLACPKPTGLFLAIAASLFGVFLRRGQGFGVWVFGFHQPLQERAAPATTGARSVAVRKLAKSSWLFDTDVLNDFATTDVKTQAEVIFVVHGGCLASGSLAFLGEHVGRLALDASVAFPDAPNLVFVGGLAVIGVQGRG